MKHDVQYLLGALRTVASVAKERGITDLYGVAEAGLDLYGGEAETTDPDETEIKRLTEALAVEAHLKEEWIAEYVKLRDGGNSEDQIKHMVDRFLCWQLPEKFNPDAGIRYTRPAHPSSWPGPSGTNLFDAEQADAMVRHMIDGMPRR